ncbi:MAG TPA: hypothetical protein VFO18_01550 [Methylomirabilota bacterium]|nr:hypothetical protein [Methylomirabilota bacterium]
MKAIGFGLALLGLALTGCASGFSAEGDLRVIARPNGIFVVTKSAELARSVCIASAPATGYHVASLDGRLFADNRGVAVTDGGSGGAGVPGCRAVVRNIIVCAEGDDRCLRHEERHAHEGAFHQ